jgi:hypothetical protein
METKRGKAGRLLLCLLTVFMMVTGGFAAFVTGDTASTAQPTAADEPGSELGEIGKQPISSEQANREPAIDGLSDSWTASNPEPTRTQTKETSTEQKTAMPSDTNPRQEPTEMATPLGSGTITSTQEPIILDSPGMNPMAITLDANGPYGTMADPKYEGETVDFHGTITGEDPANFDTRWDVDNNGVWDTPGVDGWGDHLDYTHVFTDNSLEGATLQATDWDMITTTGILFGDIGIANIYYAGGSSTYNQGLLITPTMDLTITELGAYRYEPFPRHIPYRMGLWTTGQSLLRDCYLSTAAGSNVWRYCSISPYTLSAGVTYVVSFHTQPSNYRFMMTENAVNPDTYNYIEEYTPGYQWPSRYRSSSIFRYPSYTMYYSCGGADCLSAVDVVFQYQTLEIYSAGAETFVDNVAPDIQEVHANPTTGDEGAEVTFTGSFDDPGTDDTWESRWCSSFGCSPWMPVRKFAGGANILIYHTADLYIPTFRSALIAACGPFCINVDEYNFQSNPYTLDELMPYDVVVVDTYSGATPAGTGDLLADYMDAKGNTGSGGVIVVGRGPYNPGMWQVTGRYFDDQYSPIPHGSSYWGWKSIGAVLIPDLFSGVSAVSAYPHSRIYTENSGASVHALWTDTSIAVATNENPVVPNGARAVGIPARLMSGGECTGDCVQLMVNSIKWASRQPDPVELSMPLWVEPQTLIFPDDHPMTTTPVDDFDVTLEVRDDDHGQAVQVGGSTNVMTENFASGCPPTGWTRTSTNWRTYFGTLAGGTSPECRFYWIPYGTTTSRLYTQVDMSAFGGYQVTFREYLNHFGGPYTLAIQTSTDGSTWDTVYSDVNPTGFGARVTTTIPASANAGGIMYFAMTFIGDPYNLNWWHIDDIQLDGLEVYTMEGLGTASLVVPIANVYPTAVVPAELQGKITDENDVIDFVGIEIADPALNERTESFWYRVNFDDGYETPWMEKGVIAPPPLNVLLYHSLDATGGPALQSALQGILPENAIVDEVDFYNTLVDYNYMLDYDVVVVGINLAPFDADHVGDNLAAYADMGGNVIEMVASFYTTCGWWGICGDWRNNGYTTLGQGGIGSNQATSEIYEPDHPIIDGEFGVVTSFSAGIPVSMSNFAAGSTPLARFPSYPAAAYNDLDNPNPGAGRTVGLNVFYYPGYYGAQELTLLANAIWWASQIVMPTPVIDPFSHIYADNGIYNVDFQIIDDDMWWDLSGATPVFVGPGDPMDWISHNYIPIEVYNTDPVISDVDVYVEGDLCLRMSGNKGNEAKLVVDDGYGGHHELTLIRDPGNPEFACIEDLRISLKKTDGAGVRVEYTPSDDDGANPSWIVEGYWPGDDPHKIHVVFDSKKGFQVKEISFADLFLGVPINFEVNAADGGSDDLAVVWNWGDVTPHGVHLYANAGGGPVVGFSDESQRLFDQLPNRDPWFDRPLNDIRSPWGGPLSIADIQQHAYEDPYYYYAMVTVLDDDNCDGYPSPYACDGTDMEFFELNLV